MKSHEFDAFRLERLLGDMPLEEYRRAGRDGRHLLFPGAVALETLDRFFSVRRVDEIVTTHGLAHPDIMMVANDEGKPVPKTPGGLVDAKALADRVGEGFSIRLASLERHDEGVNAGCAAFGDSVGKVVRAVSFLTPVQTQAFTPHYDERDVWIFQCHGGKRWRFYAPAPGKEPRPLPGENEPFDAAVHEAGEMIDEIVLRAGDAVFMPRGVIHAVSSMDEPSLHVAMSWKPLTPVDIAMKCLRQVQLTDVRLRHEVHQEMLATSEGRAEILEMLRTHGIEVGPDVLAVVAQSLLAGHVESLVPARRGVIEAAFGRVAATDGERHEFVKSRLWRTIEVNGATKLMIRGCTYDMDAPSMDLFREVAAGGVVTASDLRERHPDADAEGMLKTMLDEGLVRRV